MSSHSPVEQYANKSGESAYGSGQSDGGKSPLTMSLGFLKSLTEKKSTRGMYDLRMGKYIYHLLTIASSRWTNSKEERTQTRQQARIDKAPGTQPPSSKVNRFIALCSDMVADTK